MRVVIYNRKSTKDKEDQQVLSIQSQHDENLRLVAREHHGVVDTIDEEWSAKKLGRPGFARMLEQIEQGKAEAIVCWKLNRLARNPIDGGRIQWMLQQGVIKAIITSEKTYVPTDNVIQMCVEFGMATQFSIDLSKDVKRGMRDKAKLGWRPGRATVGYRNDYAGVKGEKRIFKDEERFDLVKRCWDMLLTGAYGVPKILEIATKEWNLTMRVGRNKAPTPIGLSTMYQVFTNPFYYGEYEWDGVLYRGSHEPMITRDQFNRAQDILGKKGKPHMRKYLNAYPGLVRCGECNAMIVVNVVEKKNKTTGKMKRYRYYRCGHTRKVVDCCQSKAIVEKKLEDNFFDVVGKADIPQSFIEWALQKLKLSQQDRMEQHQRILKGHQENYAAVVKKTDTLVDRQITEATKLPEDLFQEKLKGLQQEKERLHAIINDFDASVTQWTEDLISELNFTLHLRERFGKDSYEERIVALHRLGQSIQLKDGVLNFHVREPFQSLARGKLDMVKAVGSIQPLECGLQSVKPEVLEAVLPVWSG